MWRFFCFCYIQSLLTHFFAICDFVFSICSNDIIMENTENTESQIIFAWMQFFCLKLAQMCVFNNSQITKHQTPNTFTHNFYNPSHFTMTSLDYMDSELQTWIWKSNLGIVSSSFLTVVYKNNYYSTNEHIHLVLVWG